MESWHAGPLEESSTTRRSLWLGVIGLASLGLSFVLACATPFAALAALGALFLSRKDAFVAALLAFAGNQAVGFGLLGYPVDTMTMAWGVAIGLSGLAAVTAAILVVRRMSGSLFAAAVLAFASALVAQQLTIYVASFVLAAHPSAFSLPVLSWIAWTNAAAFGVLAGLQVIGARLALTTGIDRRQRQTVSAV